MLSILGLLVGFFLLVRGAHYLLDGASHIATRFGVSEMVIGLTLVSVGTSAPELVFNSIAVLNGNFDLAVGNLLGSNVSNLLLVLGTASVFASLPVSKSLLRKELFLNALIIIAVPVLLVSPAIFGGWQSVKGAFNLSRFEGFLFLLGFGAYTVVTFRRDASNKTSIPSDIEEEYHLSEKQSLPKSVFLVLVGCVFLFVGGDWIMDGSLFLCKLLGLSEGFVGLTVVAIGTSFPELATSIIASRKGKTQLLIGNIFGSNICNILLIMGFSAVLAPIAFASVFFIDLAFNLALYGLVLGLCFVGKPYQFSRPKGFLLLGTYLIYLVFLFLRG